ncbi:MAG TPA: DUF3293 domain-containing protein [Stellaceae bacterium]|jgi:hypothetical protein|nr:DUF3293 domain-containing protein [Stellaceae bacterium]
MTGLGQAYRETRYIVLLEGREITVHIGEAVAEMPLLLPGYGAIVTGWNPGSQHRPVEENRTANAELSAWIARQGLMALPSRTETADPAWVEEGFLILGITEADAIDLAWRFGQNALVWLATAEPARLVATSLWRDTD